MTRNKTSLVLGTALVLCFTVQACEKKNYIYLEGKDAGPMMKTWARDTSLTDGFSLKTCDSQKCSIDSSGNKEPECDSFVTTQGELCVSCTATPEAKPVISCVSGDQSDCQKVSVGSYICEVCLDADNEITSKKCSLVVSTQNCIANTDGDQVCVICTLEGKENYKECRQSSQSCKTTTENNKICLECFSASGKSLSKQCAPASQSCKAENIENKLCLVCRDEVGAVLSTTCPK